MTASDRSASDPSGSDPSGSDPSARHEGSAVSNGCSDDGVGAEPDDGAELAPRLFTYPGSNGALAGIRADVTRWFTDRGFSADATERAVLLVSELSSNAVEAGPGHPIDVRLTPMGGPGLRAAIAVTNTTLGDVPPPSERWAPADPLAPRGRGLAIVDALADHVRVDSTVPGRVTVVAHISG